MKVVGVIPARWGSTRFPGKSLTVLCGKPLIQWVIERARQAVKLDALMVATDDRRIYDAATAAGAQAIMTSPNHSCGTERVAEAVRGCDAEIVVNIQGDEPLVDPRLIERLAEVMMEAEQWDMATAAAPVRDSRDLHNSAVVKVVWRKDMGALYFSRYAIPYVRDVGAVARGPAHWRHIGIYAYRKTFLEKFVAAPECLLEKAEKLEQLRALYIGARIRVVETDEASVGVDTPEDVAYAESALREAGLAD